jgi:hypothetical protein
MTAVTEEELIKLNNKLKKISEGQKDVSMLKRLDNPFNFSPKKLTRYLSF